jgi:hypothetical protein
LAVGLVELLDVGAKFRAPSGFEDEFVLEGLQVRFLVHELGQVAGEILDVAGAGPQRRGVDADPQAEPQCFFEERVAGPEVVGDQAVGTPAVHTVERHSRDGR